MNFNQNWLQKSSEGLCSFLTSVVEQSETPLPILTVPRFSIVRSFINDNFLRARGIIIAWVQVHVPSVLLPRCLLKRGLLRRCSHPSQTSKGQPSRWGVQAEGGRKCGSRAVCHTKEKGSLVTAINQSVFSSPCGLVFLGETPVSRPQMYRAYLCKSYVKFTRYSNSGYHRL